MLPCVIPLLIRFIPLLIFSNPCSLVSHRSFLSLTGSKAPPPSSCFHSTWMFSSPVMLSTCSLISYHCSFVSCSCSLFFHRSFLSLTESKAPPPSSCFHSTWMCCNPVSILSTCSLILHPCSFVSYPCSLVFHRSSLSLTGSKAPPPLAARERTRLCVRMEGMTE